MKSLPMVAASLLMALVSSVHATDVGVSISISQPGVYGRIDIGRYPQPVLVQTQPVIVQRGPRLLEPVYLWVPPGHQKNWHKHCGRYNACGVPVYFVQERWYQDNVAQGGRRDRDGWDDRDEGNERRGGRGHGHDKSGKGHGKGHD